MVLRDRLFLLARLRIEVVSVAGGSNGGWYRHRGCGVDVWSGHADQGG